MKTWMTREEAHLDDGFLHHHQNQISLIDKNILNKPLQATFVKNQLMIPPLLYFMLITNLAP